MTDRQTEIQAGRKTDKRKHRDIDFTGLTDRQKERQTDKHRH